MPDFCLNTLYLIPIPTLWDKYYYFVHILDKAGKDKYCVKIKQLESGRVGTQIWQSVSRAHVLNQHAIFPLLKHTDNLVYFNCSQLSHLS